MRHHRHYGVLYVVIYSLAKEEEKWEGDFLLNERKHVYFLLVRMQPVGLKCSKIRGKIRNGGFEKKYLESGRNFSERSCLEVSGSVGASVWSERVWPKAIVVSNSYGR